MLSHSMNLDCPRESESMSMDTDDGTVSCHHPCPCDSASMNSPGPSGGRTSSGYHPRKHQIIDSVQTPTHGVPSHPPPDCQRLSGSDGSPQFMIPPSPSSPMIPLGEMGDTRQSHGLVRQRRDTLLGLEPSVREVTPRRRKHTHDSPHTHVLDHTHAQDDDASTDGANSQSQRRIRPRLWMHQDREFSPLLLMSPDRDRASPVEETISHYYLQDVTDPSRSIQRRFDFGSPREHDPCTPQSSPSPKVSDPEDLKERGRSNSFTEVALASTVPQKHGRLSTLQDFWLPRPFEEAIQPSVGTGKVYERGLEVGPLFLSANSGRTGGLLPSREPAGSPTDHSIHECGVHACSSRSAMLPTEPSLTIYFEKPICNSPDPIDPTDDDGLTHIELPTVQEIHARFNSSCRGSVRSSHSK